MPLRSRSRSWTEWAEHTVSEDVTVTASSLRESSAEMCGIDTAFPTHNTTARRRQIRTPEGQVVKRRSKPTTIVFSFLLLIVLLLLVSPRSVTAIRILLSDDDGLNQPGLTSLRDALVANNHEVHVYAPPVDKTGLSASVQLQASYRNLGDNRTEVDAPPATCVIAGLSLMDIDGIGPPDLVIVGISDGFATGSQTLHSSSVGAAMVALSRGVPALTISAIPTTDSIDEYFEGVANFTVRLVEAWVSGNHTGPLSDTPLGYGLKVSYPGLPTANVSGVRTAQNGQTNPQSSSSGSDGNATAFSLGYLPSANDPTIFQAAPVVVTDDQATIVYGASEESIIESGAVSVLPISSRFYLPASEFNVQFVLGIRRMVATLEP